MDLRLKTFVLFIFSLLFTDCSFRNCNTTLKIINDNPKTTITLIDNMKRCFQDTIIENETIYYDKEIMQKIKYVHIITKTIEGVFELSEYDHWFPSNHNIEIIIENNEFKILNSGKKISGIYSYETYIKDNENIDFETIKESEFNEIYDIIKNRKI